MGKIMKENLKPCRTTEEARERGRKGGINSGKRKKEKRKLKEIAEMLLDTSRSAPVSEDKGTQIDITI